MGPGKRVHTEERHGRAQQSTRQKAQRARRDQRHAAAAAQKAQQNADDHRHQRAIRFMPVSPFASSGSFSGPS